MNIVDKKFELINLLSKFLKNQVSLETLQNFAWELIHYFTKNKLDQLPPYQDFEKVFWYTIWQIQHLADEEHEKDGITKQVLSEALEYLEEKKKFPENYSGTRP